MEHLFKIAIERVSLIEDALSLSSSAREIRNILLK